MRRAAASTTPRAPVPTLMTSGSTTPTPDHSTPPAPAADPAALPPRAEHESAAAERVAGLHVTSRWWLPLAFVIVVLLTLTIEPVIISTRVRRLRADLTDRSGQARVLVNDLEADFATELFALGQLRQGRDGSNLARLRHAHDAETRGLRQLDQLVRGLGPDAVERYAELRALTDRWHRRIAVVERDSLPPAAASALAAGAGTPPVGQIPGTSAEDPAEILDAAERLDVILERITNEERADILRLEHLDVIFPLVLAPLALLSALAVVRISRRSLRYAREAERGRAALAQVMEQRAALIRGVTHDLKNPLGAVGGYAELLEDGVVGPLSDEQRDIIRRMHHLVGMSVDTINELLTMSRADAGQLVIQYVPTDLGRLTREVVSDWQLPARAHDLSLALDEPPPLPPVPTDPVRVQQVLGNLLSNAIKYTPEGGDVRVRVVTGDARDDGAPSRVGVEVRDTGPGIDAALQERVFEEFFRVPATQGAAPGTGLGLAISRRMARLMGGDLTVESRPGEGSAFTLWLPADVRRSSSTPPG